MHDGATLVMGATGTIPTPGIFAMLREDARCIFLRDPAARTRWEVLTTYPGLHAVMAYRCAHALWRSGWRYAARLLAFLARMLTNIDIHPGAKILGAIVVGPAARIGANSVVVKDVPSGRTVVGIPARVVGERAAPLRVPDPDSELDLDHRMPDPVGKAIGCLLGRIDALEQEVRSLRGTPAPLEAHCTPCAAGELCCEEHRHGG